MSLAVAVPCALAAALAYGASTAVQHRVAHTGRESVRGLLGLPRNPRWLASVGGDGVGLALQVTALATGPVVLVTPLLVLAVPVALLAGAVVGGPRPTRGDYLACLAVLAGLAGFLVPIGDPGDGTRLGGRGAATTALGALAAGVAVCLLVRTRSATTRAAVYAAVAGCWFGVFDVLVNAAANEWRAAGAGGLASPAGYATLAGGVVVGVLGMALTQLAFQVGPLAASYPANECAAPVAGVLLGALVLGQRVRFGPAPVLGYLACLVVVVAATGWLARPRATSAALATPPAGGSPA